MGKKSLKEILMYLIFGVATTFVSWFSFALFTKLVSSVSICDVTLKNIDIANVLSWVCAVSFAYITNKLWVFESKSFNIAVVFKEFVVFLSYRIITGVIEWFGFPLLMALGLEQSLFGIDGMLAKITISVIVVVLNYVFSKLIVFKNR